MLKCKDELEQPDSYKISWTDVNIQGDYDSYARSPLRGFNKEEASTQKVNETTSRNQPSRHDSKSQELPNRQRRRRIKLAKPTRISQELKSDKEGDVKDSAGNTPLALRNEGANEARKTAGTEVQDTKTESTGTKLDKLDTKPLFGDLNEVGMSLDDSKELSKDENVSSLQDCPAKDTEMNSAKNLSGNQKRTQRPGNSFSPPVASVIHFRPQVELGRINNSVQRKFVIRNGVLVDDFQTKEKLSRRSAIFMAKYLGMEYDPLPNRVTSILVRPMLPPVKRDDGFIPRHKWARENSKRRENTGVELAPLRDLNAYNSRKNHATTSRLEAAAAMDEGGSRREESDMFDHVIRWRSKARHCGKPAMYRRITSPTLGEVALSRKLDRLPTRQIRRNWAGLAELQAPDATSWQETSVAGIHGVRAAKVSPTYIPGDKNDGYFDSSASKVLSNVKMSKMKLLTDLLPPEMPIRKRRPQWQRMR